MRLIGVLVRRRVERTIWYLRSFTTSGSTVSPTWRRTECPPCTQLDWYNYIPQEDTLTLKLTHTSWYCQGCTCQSSRFLNLCNPKFCSFTPKHLLDIWHHFLVGNDSCRWGGWTHHRLCCNHRVYPQNYMTKLQHWQCCWFPPFNNNVLSYIDRLFFWSLL